MHLVNVHIETHTHSLMTTPQFPQQPLFTAHKEIDMIRDQFKLLGAPTRKTWPELTSMRGYGAINFSIFPKRSKLREKFPKATPGRPGLSDAGFDLLSRLLAVNPADRIIANEALHHEWFRYVFGVGGVRNTSRAILDNTITTHPSPQHQGASAWQGQGDDAHIPSDQ